MPTGTTFIRPHIVRCLKNCINSIKNQRPRMLMKGKRLLHDNTRPHVARNIKALLDKFGWDITFIDFKKAYGCIQNRSLLNIFQQFYLPQKLVNIIKISIMHTKIKIKLGNSLSNGTQITTALRQRNAQSPVLFNLALEKVVRENRIEHIRHKIRCSKNWYVSIHGQYSVFRR